MKDNKEYTFKASLSTIDKLFMNYMVVVPDEIVQEINQKRIRTKGTINGIDFSLAIQHIKNGAYYFSINNELRKKAKLTEDKEALIKFVVVDSDVLEIPEEFLEVLSQDEMAMEMFNTFTIGKQRSLCIYVQGAKLVESRIKRSLELAEKIKTRTLYGDKKV